MILFVLFAAFINLFMGSASAKWALIAPVFVPMFMLLGYTPEFAQVAYRIGDSCTNVITPMMSYFAMIIVFMKKYDKEAGIGTLVSDVYKRQPVTRLFSRFRARTAMNFPIFPTLSGINSSHFPSLP